MASATSPDTKTAAGLSSAVLAWCVSMSSVPDQAPVHLCSGPAMKPWSDMAQCTAT